MTLLRVCSCVRTWLQLTLCERLHLCEMKAAQTQAGALSSFPTVIGAICFGCVNIV